MPELPEVETIRRDLEKELKDTKFMGIESTWSKKVLPDLASFEPLSGQKVINVQRLGKLIVLNFKDDAILLHLKMTGQIIVNGEEGKFMRHKLTFSGGKVLIFNDIRKFGYIHLVSQAELRIIENSHGFEPLSTDLVGFLSTNLRGKKKPIKLILMDPAYLSGIGNIYANDALYLSKIHPLRPGSGLTKAEISRLATALSEVLTEGLSLRGASPNSYVDAYGEKGGYQDVFKVYGKIGETCWQCKKGEIERIVVGGRGTFICTNCQKL